MLASAFINLIPQPAKRNLLVVDTYILLTPFSSLGNYILKYRLHTSTCINCDKNRLPYHPPHLQSPRERPPLSSASRVYLASTNK